MTDSKEGGVGFIKHALTDEVQAVYYSALASLDELPHGQQALVVMNWAKYVLSMWAESEAPISSKEFADRFAVLCGDFAIQVMQLPEHFETFAANHGCGRCPRCIERGIKPPAPVS